MDEAQSLDVLTKLLEQLSEDAYNISLHAQHLRLAQSTPALASQVIPACEMFTAYLAAGEDVWTPLLDAKHAALDMNSPSAEVLEELLRLYDSAEEDYLSIPLLEKHLDLLVDMHTHLLDAEPPCTSLGELFTTNWTRSALANVVSKGRGHLMKSQALWRKQRDWEMRMLDIATKAEKQNLVDHVEDLHLTRLQEPHFDYEETFQSYSSFTTNYKRPEDYETLLVAASKKRVQAVKAYERREPMESTLTQCNHSVDAYMQYIIAERRPRQPDLFVLGALYERAITEAARRRFEGENGAEDALRIFWVGYLDTLSVSGATQDARLKVARRAVRSVPGSGEVWARYMRLLEQIEDAITEQETVSNTYITALSRNLIQKEVEQIIPLTLARAGYGKRLMIEGKLEEEEAFASLVAVLEEGISMTRNDPVGDPALRLEKYLADLYVLVDVADRAIAVWQLATKHYKTSYLAWTSFTDLLIEQAQYDQVRSLFKDLVNKNIDWPEAIWEAWLRFEHMYGNVREVEICVQRVEKARVGLRLRRAREAEMAALQAAQATASVQVVDVPSSAVPDEDDAVQKGEDNVKHKRKLEDVAEDAAHKKARTETIPPPLKRDRENSTVFVADLTDGVTEEDISELFRDCGGIREVKVIQLPDALVATVEFLDRDCVPAALTKDKKKVREHEVAVHLAWKSTLYVTNFPEDVDDAFIRDLFSNYGIIFDIRWPSKKFKNTRRFCYVQFVSPLSAEKALEIHGRELKPGLQMNVFISNPERRKERTDADADEREVYVAGLSKFTQEEDLRKVFEKYGPLKEVRIATENGRSKGFAFVEFTNKDDALAALGANNFELKGRRIAVTLADTRVRARRRNVATESGLSNAADVRNRCVRVRNLPPATQEGLLHQTFAKHASVKRVEVFADSNEAVVELETPAEAGKLLLRTDPIVFNKRTLEITEESKDGRSRARPPVPQARVQGMFVPRAAGPKQRAGIGHTRKATANIENDEATSKSQDDFRKMLQ